MLNSDLAYSNLVAEPITGYAVGTKSAGLVEVLVDCQWTQDLFTYNVPDRLRVQVGDILYFSEGKVDVVIALPDIIKSLHQQGFELLTISAMMSYPDDKPQ